MSRTDPKMTNVDYDAMLRETDKAYQLRIDGKDHWVPKSQVELDESTNEVSMPEWLAQDKGLI